MITKEQLKVELTRLLDKEYDVKPEDASNELFYKATAGVVKNLLQEKYKHFISEKNCHGSKRVYYLCMEFLMGRSLKNNIYNLGMHNEVSDVLKGFGVDI